MFRHDPSVFRLPFLLKFLQLRFADHRVDAGTEMPRHAAYPSHPLTDHTHRARQVLRADHHQGDDRAKQQFGGSEIEHDLGQRSEEHTSELQSLMRISYAVFCLKKKKTTNTTKN